MPELLLNQLKQKYPTTTAKCCVCLLRPPLRSETNNKHKSFSKLNFMQMASQKQLATSAFVWLLHEHELSFYLLEINT